MITLPTAPATGPARDWHVKTVWTKGAPLELIDGRTVIPGTRVGLLSAPSKMPGASWSLVAILSCPGAAFGPGHICGAGRGDNETSCYATTGRYSFDSCLSAQCARYAWTRACLQSPEGMEVWVAYMTSAIYRATRHVPFFRVHDSGDVFNAAYARAWRRVAANLPDVKFWLPTRSYRLPAILPALLELATLPNVAVKPSALTFGAPPPVIAGLDGGTGAQEEGYNCPALGQGGECRDCRHCWDKSGETIYPYHGRDVHGLATSRVHHRGATKGGRGARAAAFMTYWTLYFKGGK